MQTLYFQPAWDKTISSADRRKIIHSFQSLPPEEGIHFSFLWEAINHKEEHLVTVLIHNAQDTPLQLENISIGYSKDKQMKTCLFTLPLKIPPKTSMPWTFIFSASNHTNQLPAYTVINDE